MSSRQQNRLNQQSLLANIQKLAAVDVEDDGDSEDVDENVPVKQQKMFQFDESSSSSGESDSEEETQEMKEIIVPNRPIGTTPSSSDGPETVDDLEFLESLIKENEATLTEAVNDTNASLTNHRLLFSVDPKALDVDRVLNDRFGRNNFMRANEGEVDDGNNNNANNNRQNNMNRGVARKRLTVSSLRTFLFGPPKEDWVKPLSFIGGGMHMVRVKGGKNKSSEKHGGSTTNTNINSNSKSNSNSSNIVTDDCDLTYFTIEWSAEYHKLNELYQVVQATGDINRLIMFLANHPYHVEGLYQMGLFFARIGQMDRAADLIRRCLYCFECSFIDAFKPYSGTSRLTSNTVENKQFYNVLYKHMQFCFTLGCNVLSADICRMRLSLNPADDSHYVLLTLDYYLLCANQYELLQSFCGVSDESAIQTLKTAVVSGGESNSSANSNDSGSDNAAGISEAVKDSYFGFTLTNAFKIDSENDDKDHSVSSSSDGNNSNLDTSLGALPNWWYSLALSFFLMEANNKRKQSYNNTKNVTMRHTTSHSSYFLKCALAKYPFMLEPLLGCAGVTVGLFANSTWKQVFGHELFSGAVNRVPTGSYLQNISNIYSQRCGALWNSPEIHAWVLQCATELTAHHDTQKQQQNNQQQQQQHKKSSEGTTTTTISTAATYHDVIQAQRAWYNRLSDQQCALSQYNHARLEDYVEEVPRMPQDVVNHNLVEPQLMDPRILAGGVRFDLAAMGIQLPDRQRRQQRRNRHEQEEMARERERIAAAERAVFIDLNLPLMQLFWVSLFPWYRVPSVSRQRELRV